MTVLPTRSEATIVATISAGAQGRSNRLLDFSVGSVLLAVAEAIGGICLWLQAMILQLLLVTRRSTSTGTDVDSWLADFSLIARLGAQPATGLVTFARFTASNNAPVIPIGAIVQTSVTGTQFSVYADTTNPAYSAGAGGYVMAAGATSVQAPVSAVVAGASGNVNAGTIVQLATSILGGGVDTVTNVAAFINGVDAESDETVGARFVLAINSLSKGTTAAVAGAIEKVRVGLQYTISENADYYGNVTPGLFSVVVDDGTGAISSDLVSQVATAVNAIRAASIRFTVNAATDASADVVFSFTAAPGYVKAALIPIVEATVAANINAAGLGNPISYFDIAVWARSVPGVTLIENVLLNGGTVDLPAVANLTYKAASVTAS